MKTKAKLLTNIFNNLCSEPLNKEHILRDQNLGFQQRRTFYLEQLLTFSLKPATEKGKQLTKGIIPA